MKQTKNGAPFIMLDDKNETLPLYQQIYEAIRKGILSGEFSAKMRLPSTRDLAKNLSVSRITVTNAYEQLFAEGYLESKTGSGTFVASELPENLLQTGSKNEKSVAEKSKKLPLRFSDYGEKLVKKEVATVRNLIRATFRPFHNGLTAVEEFPFEIWSRIANKYYKNPTRVLLDYGDPQGFAPLRKAVADHLKSSRGVNCVSEQVIITGGAQQALDLTARIFLSKGDAVVIENPCYIEARSLFNANDARVFPVEIDAEGFDAAKIPQEANDAKLVYVTPSHQYPLGVTMSLARRLALIEWAKKNNAFIIEDDYNSEYRYAGRPLASMQGLDKNGRVIYIGTFSKTIFPSLRIGCAVVPLELIDVFTTARALNDVHSSIIEQAILAEFISEGHFARHLRRMRKLYEQRQQILIEECEKHLKDFIKIEKNDAGMHLVGWLPENISDKKISEKGALQKLKLAPVSDYFVEKSSAPNGLILGYTGFDERQISDGVKKLREILLLENKEIRNS